MQKILNPIPYTLNPPALGDSQNHMNLDFVSPSGQHVMVFRVLACLPVVTTVIILLCGAVKSAVAGVTAALALAICQSAAAQNSTV